MRPVPPGRADPRGARRGVRRKIKIAKLDTDANPETTAAYGIVSIPTLNVYVGGELQKSIIGARPKRALTEEIDAVLATTV